MNNSLIIDFNGKNLNLYTSARIMQVGKYDFVV